MNTFYRYLRITLAVFIGILSVSAFCNIFYPVNFFDLQFTALAQRVLVDFSLGTIILFGTLILFTLIFGRFYCSILCPFGLLQEFLLLIFRRKTAVTPNHSIKYFISALCFGTLIGGTAYLIRLIDPYTIFGSGMSGAWFGIGAFTSVAVLTWFKGRFFCSNICPVGTVLGLLSRYSILKI